MRGRIFVAIALTATLCGKAEAFSPQTEGLGGAGRSGIGKEALFTNPASVALLRSNMVFASYTQTKLKTRNAGGMVQAAGVYDGVSSYGHGGLAYIHEGRRISFGSGTDYNDQTSIRAVFGRPIYEKLLGGVKTTYTVREENGQRVKYFHGDIGFIYPLSPTLPVGLTVENVMDKQEERPRTIFLAMQYDILGPLKTYGDFGRVVSKVKSARNMWAFGVELSVFEELLLRGGLYQDSFLDTRGWAVGASWNSPRTAFEYALRMTRYEPRQRDHVFGISILF